MSKTEELKDKITKANNLLYILNQYQRGLNTSYQDTYLFSNSEFTELSTLAREAEEILKKKLIQLGMPEKLVDIEKVIVSSENDNE